MTDVEVRTGDVPLHENRTLRVGLYLVDGEPDTLVLAVGAGSGVWWREDAAEGVVLPATALEGLKGALGRLSADQELPR